MIRSSIVAGAMLSLVAVASGCDNVAADEQARANKAQTEADTKIKSAQADADKKIAEAQANFNKLREDYRHHATTELGEIDKKVTELEAKAKTATGQTKVEIEENLKVIRQRRERFMADFDALETASAASWDSAKATLEKEEADLKALVNKT